MKKSILNLEGVEVLSKKQMRNVGGAERCEAISVSQDFFYSAGDPIGECTITYHCRPTFLGIGFGRWGQEQTGPGYGSVCL